MPISPRQNLLCSYRYDALDRSINWAPIGQAGIQCFYCKDRLATEIQDSVKHSIFQHDDQVLAQQHHMDDKVDITLLSTDLQGSLLNALDAHQPHPIAYTPYGHRLPGNGLFSLLGFNGERPDPVTGHYHLGHGYRQFNPVLMRFNSPDSLSPFGKGGLNAYVYCGGNPVLNTDPTGRYIEKVISKMTSRIRRRTGRKELSPHTRVAIAETQPLPNGLGGPSNPDNVITQVFYKHKLTSADTELLDSLKSGTPEQALELLKRAGEFKPQLDRRSAVVADVLDGWNRKSPINTKIMRRRMIDYNLEFRDALLNLKVIAPDNAIGATSRNTEGLSSLSSHGHQFSVEADNKNIRK